MAVAHRKEFLDDQDYVEGDVIVMIADGPSLLEHTGWNKPQPCYGFFKKYNNRGKMKVDGKNALNASFVKRMQGEPTVRKPRTTNSAPTQASTVRSTIDGGVETVLKGVKWIPNSIQGGKKQAANITPEHIHNTKESGRFLLWSSLHNMYPASYSFGTIKKVGEDIISYVTALDFEIVDSIKGFINDVGMKRILIVKPHQALAFIATQLLMASLENKDEELRLFVQDVLEPACKYLKGRFDKEMMEKRTKYGDSIADSVVGEGVGVLSANMESETPFAYDEVTEAASEPRKATPEEEAAEVNLLLNEEENE